MTCLVAQAHRTCDDVTLRETTVRDRRKATGRGLLGKMLADLPRRRPRQSRA